MGGTLRMNQLAFALQSLFRLCPVALIICALGASMSCTRGAGMATDNIDARAHDMAAIERLHQQDTAATLAGDVDAIGETWSDDVVLLGAGQEAQVGKQAILALRRKAGGPGFRVLSSPAGHSQTLEHLDSAQDTPPGLREAGGVSPVEPGPTPAGRATVPVRLDGHRRCVVEPHRQAPSVRQA